MLRELYIRNLAVLAEASIELGPGFNVLSGETGAGKSIVVDGLALLAGARASNELIRTGASSLTVCGIFAPEGESWREPLAAAGVEAEGEELVVRREIARSGRNRVFVNDQPVTLKLLAALAPVLLRIHGQREELGLVTPDLQRTWLDRLGGAQGEKLARQTAEAYRAFRALAERLERLSGDDRLRREKIDFLRFQLAEIERAEVEAGEEEALRAERQVLRHSEGIQQALDRACSLLFEDEGSASETLAKSRQALAEIAGWEPQAAPWIAELEELGIRVDELQRALYHRRGEVEADPQRLDALEERLSVLERLFRKYGPSSAEVLERRQQLAEELAELAGDDEDQEQLEEQVATALEAYRQAAGKLSADRGRWAKKLVARVEKELTELSFAAARFAVALERRGRSGSPLAVDGREIEFGEQGWDQVVFQFSPNPGEELRPLAKVASGGELSRLYLAVQLSARPGGKQAPSSGGPTLIFDEVDSGVGGAEAAALGSKLQRLARGGQILAVTHLPQVASCGDLHFKVSKQVVEGRTHARVERLSAERREQEVARMLSGSETTELSLSHARELLAGAES